MKRRNRNFQSGLLGGLSSFVSSAAGGGIGKEARPPTFRSPSAFTIAENSSAEFTITLSEPCNVGVYGTDNSLFHTDGSSTFGFDSPPDYETPEDANSDNVYEITLRATSNATGLITEQNVTITVTDVLPAFSITGPASLTEGSSGNWTLAWTEKTSVSSVVTLAETNADMTTTLSTALASISQTGVSASGNTLTIGPTAVSPVLIPRTPATDQVIDPKTYTLGITGVTHGTFNATAASTSLLDPLKPFIVDTDFTGDPDDTMAIVVALAAHRTGNIKIVGFIVSSTTVTSAPGLYAFLKQYGCESIPIYAYQGSTGSGYNVTYPQQLRDRWGVASQTRTAYTDDLTGYRTLVKNNPGVTIVSIGAPVSLSRLLSSSADGIDDRTGSQLITDNVAKVVQMAGNFPSAGAAEYNANRDVASTSNIMTNWPSTVPFMWTGGEVGGTVYTMAPHDADPSTDPTRYAMDLGQSSYLSTSGRRSSWDPIAVHYAIYGLGSLYSVGGANGSMTITGTSPNAVTAWSATTGPHSYLSKVATDDRIANAIDVIVDDFIMGATRQSVSSFFIPITEGSGQIVTSSDGKLVGSLGSTKNSELIDPVWTDQGTNQWSLTLTTGKIVALPYNPGMDSANYAGGAVIKIPAITGTQMLLAMNDLGPNTKFMFRNNAGKLNFIGYTAADGTTNFNVSSASVVLTAATWAVCTFEIIGTSLKMYVNGVQVYSGTVSGSIYVSPTKRIIRPTLFGRYNGNTISDALLGVGLCAGLKAGAVAGDAAAIETLLRANATAKGITLS